MIFDLIENYRVWTDIVVMKIFAGRKFKDDQVSEIPNGFTLNQEGKKVLISSLNEYLDETIRYGGRNLKRINTMQMDCHKLANSFIGDDKNDQ